MIGVGMLIAMVLATAVSAYSSYESGQQQKKASEYNASVAEWQAGEARKAAELKASDYQKEAALRLSRMRASYGASGVETTEGTPLLVLMESAKEAETDRQRILYGGEVSSWGLLSQATLDRYAGKGAARAGTLGAGASLLSGASSAASIYSSYQYRQKAGY